MLLIVDNYDSFVFNIFHWIPYDEKEIQIIRNDLLDFAELEKQEIKGIIISPGPMGPEQTGKVPDLLERYWKKVPILGICLGHQTIGHFFSCRIVQYENPVHGEAHQVNFTASVIYEGLPESCYMGRYHSLIISEDQFNHAELKINARMINGIIMGIEHKNYPLFGVQFHPESVLSGNWGKKILENFVKFL